MKKNTKNSLNTKKQLKDIIYVVLFLIILFIVLINIDFYEFLISFTREHEEYELDEIILALLIMPIPLLWYCIRRINDVNSYKNELIVLNKELKQKVQKQLNQALVKDKIITHKYKMASLGEMLENIAHQWREPLNVISLSIANIQFKKDHNQLNDITLDQSLSIMANNTRYLSQTIDDFRNYLNTKENIKTFEISSCVNKSLEILKGAHIKYDIETFVVSNNINIINSENQLTQTLLILFNNSKDAFLENNIQERFIFIDIVDNKDFITIYYKDNANGIDNDILNKVFEPYFTTKDKIQGTGLGLFIAYNIVTLNMQGEIKVENESFTFENKVYKGAKFSINLPKVIVS